jgi:hypothetical protein
VELDVISDNDAVRLISPGTIYAFRAPPSVRRTHSTRKNSIAICGFRDIVEAQEKRNRETQLHTLELISKNS